MQYIFLITGNQILYQVQYWGQAGGGQMELYSLGGTILSLPSNTVPAGYLFEIDLNNDTNGNVTGGTFKVTDNNRNTTSVPFQVNQNFL